MIKKATNLSRQANPASLALQATGLPLDQPWSGTSADTILEVLYRACTDDPDAPAFIFEGGLVLSRRDLQERVEGFAGYLKSRLQPGDRIAIQLGNRAEWMVAWFAAVGCRLTVVSMNPAAQEHDALQILVDSRARLVIADAEHAELFERLGKAGTAVEDVLIVGANEPDGLAAYRQVAVPLEALAAHAQRDDICNVYFTSGTSGVPKATAVDHEYWLRFVDVFQRRYGMGPTDRMLCCLQFYYNDPPWQTLLSLTAGAPLVVMRRFSVSRFWPMVRDNDVTVVFGIASTANLLLSAPPSELDRTHKVRFAMHVGIPAGLHASLVERWGVPWVEGYGLTESGVLVSTLLDDAERLIGTGAIGSPTPEAEVRVVGPNGEQLGPGGTGELIIRAPGMMRGYLNRPEATADILRNGWLHSGDLASIDAEGIVYYRGRMKDIVRRSGENITAAEVEEVLRSHPRVLDAAIVPVPDELRGEEVHAVVVRAVNHDGSGVEGSSDVDQLTAPELVEYAASRLAKYKVPRYFSFRSDDFARTPSMRVKKSEINASTPEWDRQAELGW